MLKDLLVLPPGIPVALNCGRVVGVVHELVIALFGDGLLEGEFLFVALFFFLEHIGGLLFGLDQLVGIAGDQEPEHLILLQHKNN